MKTRPELLTRSGKSNVLKNQLSNLRENDLHYENNKITQCRFLGVLKLKPVPSAFSSTKLSPSTSSTVSDNSRKGKKHPIRITSKSISTDINKVISGKVIKKTPEKIKASVKKLPSKKSNIIKVKFNMDKKNLVEENDLNVPDSKTNVTDSLNQSKIIATSARMQYNSVPTLFNKLKLKKDNSLDKQSFGNEEITYTDFRASKSPKNKSLVFETNYSSSETTSTTKIQSKISHFSNESPDRIKKLFAENNPTEDIVIIDRELSPVKQKERTSPRFRRVSIMEGNKSRKYKERTSSSKSLYPKQKTMKDSANSKSDIIVIDDDTGTSEKNSSDNDIICLTELTTIKQTVLSDCIEVVEHSNLNKNNLEQVNQNKSSTNPEISKKSLNTGLSSSHHDDDVLIISTMIAEPSQEKTSPANPHMCTSTNQVKESNCHIHSIHVKSTQKNKPRRSRLAPAPIPSIFLQTPRLLRSELSQKNVKKDNPKPKSRDSVKLQKLNIGLPEGEKQSQISTPKSIKSPLNTFKKSSSPKKHKNRAISDKNLDNDTIFVSEEIKSSNQEGKPSLKLIIRQKKKTDIMNTERPVNINDHISQDLRSYVSEKNSKKSSPKPSSNLTPSSEKDFQTDSVKKLIQDLTDDDVIEIPSDSGNIIPKINEEISNLPTIGKKTTHDAVIVVESDTPFENINSLSNTKSNMSNEVIHIVHDDDPILITSPRLMRSTNSKKSPQVIVIDDEKANEIVSTLGGNINKPNILTKEDHIAEENHEAKQDVNKTSERRISRITSDIITISDDIIEIESENSKANILRSEKTSKEINEALQVPNDTTASDQDKVVIDINDEQRITASSEIDIAEKDIANHTSPRTLRSNNKALSNVSEENTVECIVQKLELINMPAISEKSGNIQENADEKLYCDSPNFGNETVKSTKSSPSRTSNKSSPKLINSFSNIEHNLRNSSRLLRSNKGKSTLESKHISNIFEVDEIVNTIEKNNNPTDDKPNQSLEEKSIKNGNGKICASKESSFNSSNFTDKKCQKNLMFEGASMSLAKTETVENEEKANRDVLPSKEVHTVNEILPPTTYGINKEIHLKSNTESAKGKPSRFLRSQKSEKSTGIEQIVKNLHQSENAPTSQGKLTHLQVDSHVNDSISLKIEDNKTSKQKGNKPSTLSSSEKIVDKTEEKSDYTNLSVIPSKNFYGNENNGIILNDSLNITTSTVKKMSKSTKKSVKSNNSKTNKKVPIITKPIMKVSQKSKQKVSKAPEEHLTEINLKQKEKSLTKRSLNLSKHQTEANVKIPKKPIKRLPKVISTKLVKRRSIKKCDADKVSKITKYFGNNEKIFEKEGELNNPGMTIDDKEDSTSDNALKNEVLLSVGKKSTKPSLKKVTFQGIITPKNKRKRVSRTDKNMENNQEELLQNTIVTKQKTNSLKSLDTGKVTKKGRGRVRKNQKRAIQIDENRTQTQINQDTSIQITLNGEEEKNNKQQDLSKVALIQDKRQNRNVHKIAEESTRNGGSNHRKRNGKTQNIVENCNKTSSTKSKKSSSKMNADSSNNNLEDCGSIQEDNSVTEKNMMSIKKEKKEEGQLNYPKIQNNDYITKRSTSKQLAKKIKLAKKKKKGLSKLSKKNKQKKKICNPLDSLQIAEIVNSIQAIEISEEKKDEKILEKTSETTITPASDSLVNVQQNETSWIDLGPQKKKRGRPKKLDSEKLNKPETKSVKQKHNKVSITQLKTPSKNKLYEEIPNKMRKLKTTSKRKSKSQPEKLEEDIETVIKKESVSKNDVKIPKLVESKDGNQEKYYNAASTTPNQFDHSTDNISEKNNDENCVDLQSPVKKQRNRPNTLGVKTPEKSYENVSFKRKHDQIAVSELKNSEKNNSNEEIRKKMKKLASHPQRKDSNSTILESIESVISKNCDINKDTTIFDFDEDESDEPIQLQFKTKQNKDGDVKSESKQSTPINHSKVLTQNETPQKTSPIKSPMKQATIMEMFEKITKEQKQNLAKPLFETPKPTEAGNVHSNTNEKFEEVVRNTSKRRSSQMLPPPTPKTFNKTRNEDDDDDDDDFSDDDSRAEWIPEEYAEYKFKYSAKKLKPHIFRCKVCLMTFPSYPKLVKHKASHVNAANPYECKQCKETFKDVDDLVAHLKIHKGEHPYKCSKCNEGFWTKDEYNKHLPIHILRKVKEPPKKYQCDLCGKAFVKLCDMDRHTRVHTGEKPSVCNICGKGFQQSHNLSKHLITHLQLRPFKCEICDKQFNRPDVLSRHVLTHAVEKPFKCASCPKSFIRQIQLNMHIEHEHKNKKNGKQSTESNKETMVQVKNNETPKRRKKIKIEKDTADKQVAVAPQ